jgi:hypothetical protein
MGLSSAPSIRPTGIPTRTLKTLAATTSRCRAAHFVKGIKTVAVKDASLDLRRPSTPLATAVSLWLQ